MEKVLYIVRGIPGSGKSTFAKQLTANVFEADHYFYDNDGNYKFIASEIKDAHKECQDNIRIAMESSIPKIAVSNTSTQEWEMEPYFELAKKYGYKVFTIILFSVRPIISLNNTRGLNLFEYFILPIYLSNM